MTMRISQLPQETLSRLRTMGFAVPNKCFANCANIVFGLNLGNYVLCLAIDVHGQEHPHAVFEHNHAYYDPTLQDHSYLLASYRFVKSLSRDELIHEMVMGGATYSDSEGTIEGLPPALLMDGTVKCIEVETLWPQA